MTCGFANVHEVFKQGVFFSFVACAVSDTKKQSNFPAFALSSDTLVLTSLTETPSGSLSASLEFSGKQRALSRIAFCSGWARTFLCSASKLRLGCAELSERLPRGDCQRSAGALAVLDPKCCSQDVCPAEIPTKE